MKRSLAIGLASLTLLAFKIAPRQTGTQPSRFQPLSELPCRVVPDFFQIPQGYDFRRSLRRRQSLNNGWWQLSCAEDRPLGNSRVVKFDRDGITSRLGENTELALASSTCLTPSPSTTRAASMGATAKIKPSRSLIRTENSSGNGPASAVP